MLRRVLDNEHSYQLSSEPVDTVVLTINGGSSSIKFALFRADESPERLMYGKIDRIGLPGTSLTFHDLPRNQQDSRVIQASVHRSAANVLIDWLDERIGFTSIRAVGHRVVHGMKHTEPERITQELLDELHRISPYDPDHLQCGQNRQRWVGLTASFCLEACRLFAEPKGINASQSHRIGDD